MLSKLKFLHDLSPVYIHLVEVQSVPESESPGVVEAGVHAAGVVARDVEIPPSLLSLNRSPVIVRPGWCGVSVLGKVGPGLSEKVFDNEVFLLIETVSER